MLNLFSSRNLVSSAPATSAIQQLLDGVEPTRLNNGAMLYLIHQPEAPRLALNFYIPGGNRIDPVPGMADMIDNLLLKGTTSRSMEDIAIAIDSLSLDVDTETRRDYSLIEATLLEEDLEPSLALLSDLFFNATFADFEREKEKMAGEIQMELDSPRVRASDLYVKTLFENTPYNAVGSVVLENLANITSVEALKGHHHHVYRPDHLTIVAAGNVDKPKLCRLLESHFKERHPSGVAVTSAEGTLIKSRTIETPVIKTHPWPDASQAQIFKGWFMPEATHPDFVPMSVLNIILGAGGLSARMFVNLRDKQGLAYHVRSSLETYLYRGAFTLYIGTEASNIQKCLDGFVSECEDLIQNKVSQTELSEAKKNLLGKQLVYLETAPNQASYLGGSLMIGRDLDYLKTQQEKVEAVTPEDIQAVAQRYLTQPYVASIVGPPDKLAGF